MKYRFERKFVIENITKPEIELLIKTNPALFSEIYYERQVNNIYFDSLSFENYRDNVEGNPIRNKVRIRWYGKEITKIDNPKLEIKSKKGTTGTKLAKKIANLNLNKDISKIASYGKFMHPVLLNHYTRKYFRSADKKFRITVDYDLGFYKIDSRKVHWQNHIKNPKIIVELKYANEEDVYANNISRHFPFRVGKFSKYAVGIESLYGLSY